MQSGSIAQQALSPPRAVVHGTTSISSAGTPAAIARGTHASPSTTTMTLLPTRGGYHAPRHPPPSSPWLFLWFARTLR